MSKLIFGYHKDTISAELFEDGTFLAVKRKNGNISRSEFQVSAGSVDEIREILDRNDRDLRTFAGLINGLEEDFEGENFYIFGDLKIIDWDSERLRLEEERKKHPSYYQNAMKVELTEKYVWKIFGEICRIIEEDEKEVQHMQFLYRGLL
jgi:hypothetical protein